MWSSSDCVSAGFTPAIGSSSMTSSGLDHEGAGHLEQLALAAGQAAGEVVALGVELEARRAARRPGSVLASSCAAPAAGRTGRARMLSPAARCAPSSMLSSTVSRDSALVSWKVRTMPARATLCGAAPLRASCRRSATSPASGWSNPVSRLKKVVLPAPLGPIRAVMAPRWISRWSTSTAVRPPKRRTMSSTTRIGSGLVDPGSCGTSARAAAPAAAVRVDGVAVVGASAGIERQLLLVAEDALRSEDHQQHQRQADQDEADLADLRAVE